jgi:hypothetical protein
MSQTGQLALLPVAYKLELLNRAFSGWVEDEEEDAVLTLLRETKAVSYAEFMQLIAAMTWERLYNAIDGDQMDNLEAMMQP